MKEVNSAIPCFSNFEHFVEDIKLSLGSLMTSSDVHVKREANLAAHSLAQKATTYVVDATRMEEIPNVIYGIFCRELCISYFLISVFAEIYINENLFKKNNI